MIDVETWQRRLEDNFSQGGVTGGQLLPLIDAENQYGIDSLAFAGHRHLADAFYGFFLDSLELAEKQCPGVAPNHRVANWKYLCIEYVSVFKTFRAADNLLIHGYPLNGFSLFRDLKGKIITIGGLIAGHTTYDSFVGFTSANNQSKKTNAKKISKKRQKATSSVMKRMFGDMSPLSKKHKKELEEWAELFHAELHNSSLTTALDGPNWMLGKERLPVFPQSHKLAISMYMNRFSEVAWLATRILPYLQLTPNAFGEEWANKWGILDDSFQINVIELENLGKEIGAAFKAFMETCFDFDTTDTYP